MNSVIALPSAFVTMNPSCFSGGDVGQRIEDVREELDALRERPVLHGCGDDVGGRRIERCAGLHRGLHRLEGVLGERLLHRGEIEDVGPQISLSGPRAGVGATLRFVTSLIACSRISLPLMFGFPCWFVVVEGSGRSQHPQGRISRAGHRMTARYCARFPGERGICVCSSCRNALDSLVFDFDDLCGLCAVEVRRAPREMPQAHGPDRPLVAARVTSCP